MKSNLRFLHCTLALAGLLFFVSAPMHAAEKKAAVAAAPAATDPYAEVQPATETLDLAMYQRIRDEGLNHSHVMEFGSALIAQRQARQRVDTRHIDQDRPRECPP